MKYLRKCISIMLCSTLALAQSVVAENYTSDYAYVWSGGSEFWSTPTENDPISMATGAFFEDWSLFSLGGPVPLYCTLHYRPELWNHFPVNRTPRLDAGYGVFSCNHNIELIEMTNRTSGVRQVHVQFGDHEEVILYDETSQTYLPTGSTPLQLKTVGNYYYLSNPQTERVYMFRPVPDSFSDLNGYDCTWWGRVQTVTDRNGNQLSYTYTDEQQPRLQQISDGLGRTVTLSYYDWGEGAPLETITDSNGRNYTFTHAGNTFTSMVDPESNMTAFEVGTGNHTRLITRIVRPEGNSHIDQTWTSTPKGAWVFGIQTQYDAYSNRSDISYSTYSNGNMRVMFTYPDGTSNEVQNINERFPSQFADRDGNQADIGYNSNHQITAITDRLGDSTTMSHHPETGRLASFTNALGNGISHTYTSTSQTFTNAVNSAVVTFTFHDRTRTDYPDGTYATIAYDSRGNLTNHTDRAGASWSFTYSAKGQPLTATNPNGGISTRTYNADGTLASMTDNDTDTSLFGYDAYKRLATINPPGAGQSVLVYDLMDRITATTNALGHATHFAYDDNGNLVSVNAPDGHEISYEYDLMDRLVKTSDRTGGTNTVAYTYDGLPIAITNANGIVTTMAYDSARNPTNIQTAGHAVSHSYDLEAVLTSATSPEGRTVEYQTDVLGNATAIVTPSGQTNLIVRDSMTRVTATIDPLGHQTRYDYDGMSRLKKVTLPDSTSATYTRDGLGSLTNINDLNGQNWGFTYTPMGRLATTTDPLSRNTIYTRDARGRVATITYPDGTTVSNTYDSTSQIIRRLYSDATDLTYAHNSQSALTNTTDLALTRDHSGRILTSTHNGRTFGVTRDSGGRIATATYGGALTVTYTYDAANRLERIADTLGNQIDFAFDADGNVTNTIRANGINAAYTRDINGRLIHIQDGTFIDLTYVHDAAGQITSMSGTYPLSPVDTNSAIQEYSVDAASQVSEPGYIYDDCGRATALPGHTLAWDAAERLTTLNDTIAFTYNGLSEIVSRTEGSTTTRYHHNHALGLGLVPIIAEEQNAAILRYYIYTPSGQLLYSITPGSGNAVAYYHRDHLGSTLALTDAAGIVTDRYAYGPYGKQLGHSGTSTQHFTFIGTWGVRQEGDLYQMRRRYYDPTTARFLSKEPIWPQIDEPSFVNPYQYAASNPLRYLDPMGTTVTEYSSREAASLAMRLEQYEDDLRILFDEIDSTDVSLDNLREIKHQGKDTLLLDERFRRGFLKRKGLCNEIDKVVRIIEALKKRQVAINKRDARRNTITDSDYEDVYRDLIGKRTFPAKKPLHKKTQPLKGGAALAAKHASQPSVENGERRRVRGRQSTL